jgi:hypothetical protein
MRCERNRLSSPLEDISTFIGIFDPALVAGRHEMVYHSGMLGVWLGFRKRYSMPRKRVFLPVKLRILAGHDPIVSVSCHNSKS